jgi:cytochrome c oxidase subunit II
MRGARGGGTWANHGFPRVVSLAAVIHRATLVKMVVVAALAALVATLVAVLIPWLPESASEEMDRIIFTYWFATIICIGIFALVAAVIIEAVWAFRVQPDDDTDGPPIHGHTGLEVAWTVVPAILVIAIGIVSAVVLSQNADAGDNPLKVKVFAQQFAWRFDYEGDVQSDVLVMPVDRAVEFQLESGDVIHSLWIPEMGQKQDVVPGVTQEIVITPTRTGSFTLVCTELCGLGHSTMRAPVRVLEQRAFTAWLEKQGGADEGPAAGGGTVERGSEIFASAGCGGCHALAKAGTDAQVGPPLDELTDPAAVRRSIVDPDAEITSGYQGGVMPSTFGETLSDQELDALVDYLTGKEAE